MHKNNAAINEEFIFLKVVNGVYCDDLLSDNGRIGG